MSVPVDIVLVASIVPSKLPVANSLKVTVTPLLGTPYLFVTVTFKVTVLPAKYPLTSTPPCVTVRVSSVSGIAFLITRDGFVLPSPNFKPIFSLFLANVLVDNTSPISLLASSSRFNVSSANALPSIPFTSFRLSISDTS